MPATCCIIILFVFDLPAYTSPTNFPAVLSLFLLYGCVAHGGGQGVLVGPSSASSALWLVELGGRAGGGQGWRWAVNGWHCPGPLLPC